ncbi:MAG: signal peptidase II [Opitutaceae bacterium]
MPDHPTTADPADASGEPNIENRKSRISRVAAYRLLLALAAGVLVLDQATKFWIAAHVPFDPFHSHAVGNDIPVIRGFFYLIHVGNTGAAWSMFTGRSMVLAALAAGTLLAIYFWRHSLGLRQPLAQICFGLLCGGIIGNLIDRLLHGHVIDFVDLHFGSYIYPTFNVADSGICVGVILYILQSLRAPR